MTQAQSQPTRAADRPLRLGLIGCGVVSTRDVLPNLVRPEVRQRLELVAVCDIVEPRARATAEVFGVPRYYADYEQLVRDPDIDAVAIQTPVSHHLPAALAAVQAGKHVYVQKTITLTVAEADRLIVAARAAGVQIVAAPGNHIRSQIMREIRDHVRGGRVGKICWGRSSKGTRHEDDARRNDTAGRDVDPTWYYKSGGGPLRDAAVYDIHTLTWMLGPARRVMAMSGVAVPVRQWRDRTIDVEMDDNTHFILDFGDNRFVVFSSQFIKDSPRVPTLELYGEHGAFIVPGDGSGTYEFIGESADRDRHGFKEKLVYAGRDPIPVGQQTGLEHYIVADIVHLADCVASGRHPILSAEHARHAVEIIEKVYQSARTGQTLDLATTFPNPDA